MSYSNLGLQQINGSGLQQQHIPQQTWVGGLNPINPLQQQYDDSLYRALCAQAQSQAQQQRSVSVFHGNAFVIVCNGTATELPENATIDHAQAKAEELTHKHQTEAFILKPVRKVAPKRDVVTTDL